MCVLIPRYVIQYITCPSICIWGVTTNIKLYNIKNMKVVNASENGWFNQIRRYYVRNRRISWTADWWRRFVKTRRVTDISFDSCACTWSNTMIKYHTSLHLSCCPCNNPFIKWKCIFVGQIGKTLSSFLMTKE